MSNPRDTQTLAGGKNLQGKGVQLRNVNLNNRIFRFSHRRLTVQKEVRAGSSIHSNEKADACVAGKVG